MKRGYSREFPSTGGRLVTIQIDAVSPALRRRVKEQAKREGVSVRTLVLRWLTNWVEGRRPDEEPPAEGEAR